MKSIFLVSILLVLFESCSLKTNFDSDRDLKTINISQGLNNAKDYPLSYFVKEVDLLELESGKDYYTKEPMLWFIGEKYILVYDKSLIQIFLFSRGGKFITKIGSKGQGPGEYLVTVTGTMNKDESKIIVVDKYTCDVIIYDLNGNVVVQKNIADYLPIGVVENVSWNFNNCIDFLSPRPAKKDLNYSAINQFDNNLNYLRGLHQTRTKTEAGQFNIVYYNIFEGTQGSYYWASDNDTVFQFDNFGNYMPAFQLILDENSKSKEKGLNPAKQGEKVFIHSVNMIKNHLVIWLSPNSMQTAVYYDLNTGETFSIQKPAKCGSLMQGLKTVSIDNDLCGYEPVTFTQYYPIQNICPENIPFWLPFFEHRANCIKSLFVKQPEIRDQLYEYFAKPEKVTGMVLLIYHMK